MIYPATQLLASARRLEGKLREIRRDLHRHPELAFEEFRTTGKIKEVLSTLPNVALRDIAMRTGVCADIAGSSPDGKAIALRCDIDALPIQEENTHGFQSETQGRMHACGHDGHVAVLLGAAMLLSEFRPRRDVRLLFQPAEESTPDGAPDFLACNVLDGVSEAWGFHLNATSDFGNVGWCDGTVMAGSTSFRLTVKGKSVHTAYPEHSVNPAVILGRIAVELDGIGNGIRATRPWSVTVTSIQTGEEGAVATPPDGMITGRIAFHEKEIDDFIRARIAAIAKSFCDLYGASFDLAFEDGFPLTFNTPDLGEIVRGNARAFGLPLERIFPSMGSDDFGYYGRDIPTYYMTFGLRTGPDFPIAHTSRFNFDEAILPTGALMMASVALRGATD